eukprot:2125242-Rhodomonas_salina.1
MPASRPPSALLPSPRCVSAAQPAPPSAGCTRRARESERPPFLSSARVSALRLRLLWPQQQSVQRSEQRVAHVRARDGQRAQVRSVPQPLQRAHRALRAAPRVEGPQVRDRQLDGPAVLGKLFWDPRVHHPDALVVRGPAALVVVVDARAAHSGAANARERRGVDGEVHAQRVAEQLTQELARALGQQHLARDRAEDREDKGGWELEERGAKWVRVRPRSPDSRPPRNHRGREHHPSHPPLHFLCGLRLLRRVEDLPPHPMPVLGLAKKTPQLQPTPSLPVFLLHAPCTLLLLRSRVGLQREAEPASERARER